MGSQMLCYSYGEVKDCVIIIGQQSAQFVLICGQRLGQTLRVAESPSMIFVCLFSFLLACFFLEGRDIFSAQAKGRPISYHISVKICL